jgi:hypothetical protein
MAWRYLLQRYNGTGWGEFLHTELPLTDVSITLGLNSTDELTAQVTPAFASLKDDAGRPLFDEYGTAIWAENDGDIRGGGILVGSSLVGPKWGLRCTGLAGYPYGMPYTGSGYLGVEVDPMDTWRAAWDHLQSQPGGNLALQISQVKSGLKVGVKLEQISYDTESGPIAFESGPIKMNWYETHDLGEYISDLAEATPFEYRERHWWEGSEIKHALDAGYPRLGRRLTDMRFALGENIFASPAMDRDGSKYASDALVLGAGNGRTMIKGYAHNNTGKIRRVAVVEKKQVRTIAAANSYALAWVKRSIVSGSISTVLLRNHPHAPVTAIKPGDEIPLNVSDDWTDQLIWCRVNSIQISPDSSDDATLTVVRSDQVS